MATLEVKQGDNIHIYYNCKYILQYDSTILKIYNPDLPEGKRTQALYQTWDHVRVLVDNTTAEEPNL